MNGMPLPRKGLRIFYWIALAAASILGAVPPATSLAVPPGIGLFLGPPVPVESTLYEIEVSSVSYGPPVTVAKATTVVNAPYVDTTIYLDHGSSSLTSAAFIAVQSGPSLLPGTYTFRYFTADRFPGDTTYGPVSDILGTKVAYVTVAQNFFYAVEYYNAARNHYFMTAYASEIALLDAGYFPGWVRTFQSFRVYLTDPATSAAASGLSPVCRFYGLPDFGLDTHFFSASPDECAAVKAKWPTQWILETPNAFYVYLPNTADGSCPDGTVPVYRVYNNRADVNHRYATSLAIRQQMIDAGWIPEGYGSIGVGMCVPAV
jgi:hypothetical protein